MENKIEARHLNLYYGQKHALKDVSLDIKENKITAFIGPSGCGKSTFLKTLNRMNDYVDNVKIEGDVILDGEDIYDSRVDTTLLRKKVGMVFQQPNPFPMSIYDNVAYGPRIHGIKNKKQLDKSSSILSVEIGSKALVGSSNKITSGCTAKARAIHNLCCCPPDKPKALECKRSETSS